MSAQVLLLRGVNVGGHGKLPMADLRALLLDLGGGTVRTYIQSGNAVVARAVAAGAVAGAVEAAHGFRPDVLALSEAEWRERVATRAFAEDPKVLHGFFGADLSLPDMAPLEALKGPSEEIAICPGVIWLHAPDGIGRSKLAAGMEKAAGRRLTARNWRSVAAISDLLEEVERLYQY